MKLKKYIYKKHLTRENLIEFSILVYYDFYSGAIKNNIENILAITFSNSENDELKDLLISLIKSNNSEKDIENEVLKTYPGLLKNIVENSI